MRFEATRAIDSRLTYTNDRLRRGARPAGTEPAANASAVATRSQHKLLPQTATRKTSRQAVAGARVLVRAMLHGSMGRASSASKKCYGRVARSQEPYILYL